MKARAVFSIDRTYPGSIDDVWALWTTKAGIESWWGPEGFDVTVVSLDLHAGGTSDRFGPHRAPELAKWSGDL